MSVDRRTFLKTGAVLAAASGLGIAGEMKMEQNTKLKIRRTDSNLEREPLLRPFGFKGGYMTQIWQTAALLESESGRDAIGVCTQSVLWSDARVFSSHSENGGNALMYALTERALQIVRHVPFTDPVQLLETILPEVYEQGKKITGRADLRKTFALNSLVGVDNAAWILYAAENNITLFDDLIPPAFKPALAQHHDKVAGIPLMAYAIPIDEIQKAVEQGYFFMKIKIGQPGTQTEMLDKDKARITAIHQAIGSMSTPYTKNGKLPYYFDANGRYEKKETLLKLIDHIKSIGAFDQIAIIEEPFPEEYEADVKDIPVRLAADESAHTDEDACKRMDMGYGAIALKAIAKTLSMTMKIAQAAHERRVPCFCADLTVNPILVDWNKNIAGRLAPFPGIGMGLLETNGHQNYRNWPAMLQYHPCCGAEWTKVQSGIFTLDADFYARSGGIFMPSSHYREMLPKRG
jgi:hypothetical protein